MKKIHIWQNGRTYKMAEKKSPLTNEQGEHYYPVSSGDIYGAAQQLCGLSEAGYELVWHDTAPDWVNNPAANVDIGSATGVTDESARKSHA